MNEPYGRNPQQGSRSRHGEDRNWDQGHDSPRQPQQWHDESFDQQGGWQEDQARNRQQGGYSTYGDNRHESAHIDESRYRNTGNASADHRGYERGMRDEDYNARRAYQSGASYGSHRPERHMSHRDNDFRSFTGNDYGGHDFSADAPAPYGVYGAYAGADRSFYGRRDRDDYGARSRGPVSSNDYGGWREYGESRGFLQRAGDEIASWFGDDDAARRREQDHRGRGPANYVRSDERIREDANDALTRDWAVDASELTVKVQNGEVTLEGTVHSRIAKRRAEDCVDDISGVKHVQNNLRVKTDWSSTTAIDAAKAAKATSASTPGTTSTAR